MITSLAVAITAAILAGYAKGKIQSGKRIQGKWGRFFDSGAIRRM